MKKFYLPCISCCVLFTVISLSSFAQTETEEPPEFKRHQIAIGSPVFTVQEIATGLSAIVSDIVGQDVDDVKSKGAFSLSYRYFISRRWGVGVTGVYERIEVNYKNPAAKSTFNTIAVMANAQFNHVIRPRFDLYSRLGAGICNFNQSGGMGNSSDNVFAFQVTALGMRAGGVFNAFAELGFGYEGILHAGFSLQL
ncbi:MAG: outer membrane beta-barrel protein [Niastella sp.]|nr:outer membrane beta-barrel protein [Niastella sp.]